MISNAPDRAISTRKVSPSESQTGDSPNHQPPKQTPPREIAPKAELPLPKRPEPSAPIVKLPPAAPPTMTETGLASWYGPKFNGKRTASGEIFNQEKFTAAHPTLPWGSLVKVTNLANGKSVDVRINDRGPFGKGRIIDLSRAAAKALDMVHRGIATVRLEWLPDSETPNESNELVLQNR